MPETDNHFLELAAPGVRALRPYQPGKPVDELEREFGIRNAIKLASNENPLGPSPKAIKAMQDAVPSVHLYPDGNVFYLKNKMANHLDITPKSLVFGKFGKCFSKNGIFPKMENRFCGWPVMGGMEGPRQG